VSSGTRTLARRAVDIFDRSWSNDSEVRRSVLPGDFEVKTEPSGQRQFWFRCPGPCGCVAPLALRPVVNGAAQSWEFDGNEKAPTLHPSINHVGCWHGWLKAGVFTEC